MIAMSATEYRLALEQLRYPAKDRATAVATGKSRYFGKCKRGHEVRYRDGGCVSCTQEKGRRKERGERFSAMLNIERLKDEMKLQALIKGNENA